MGFLDDFGDLLNDQVQIFPATGTNNYGEITYGTPALYRCRIQDTTVAHRTRDTIAYTHSVVLFLPPDAIVALDSKVVLPDNSSRPIRMVNADLDENNNPYSLVLHLDTRPPKS